jgi:hypothetical protein
MQDRVHVLLERLKKQSLSLWAALYYTNMHDVAYLFHTPFSLSAQFFKCLMARIHIVVRDED